MKKLSLICFLLLLPFNLSAAEPLRVTYGLFAGGFNVVEVDGVYTLDNNTYSLSMDLETSGMLGKVAPWSGVIESNGLFKGAQSTPLKHSFASTWRDETETTLLNFNDNGILTSMKTIEGDGSIDDKMPDAAILKNNPVDMLSALFRAMNNPSCESSQTTLDSKRSFNMVFKSKGTEILEKNNYSNFSGQAEICEIEIVPIAGKWRDKPRGWMSIQGQAKENGQLPRIWFGKIRDDMPPIPVRFLIKTNYGTMIMHLSDVQ